MGNIQSNTKVNFEYMQNCIEYPNSQIVINVLDNDLQHCLIYTTVHAREEEEIVNEHIKNDKTKPIIIYGKNCCDEKVLRKHKQLINYGFKNVKIYFGGLFEWLCLQDIYGKEKFKTNGEELDILKYK
jgi:rhodanese-related sulfurtransferase